MQLEKKRRWLSLWRPLCSPQTHLLSFIKGINTHQRFYISKRNTEVWCPTPGSFLLLTELGAGGGRWKGSQGGRGPFSPRKMNHERSPHPHSSSSGWGTCQGIKPQARSVTVLKQLPQMAGNSEGLDVEMQRMRGRPPRFRPAVITFQGYSTASRASSGTRGMPCLNHSHHAEVRALTEIVLYRYQPLLK